MPLREKKREELRYEELFKAHKTREKERRFDLVTFEQTSRRFVFKNLPTKKTKGGGEVDAKVLLFWTFETRFCLTVAAISFRYL